MESSMVHSSLKNGLAEQEKETDLELFWYQGAGQAEGFCKRFELLASGKGGRSWAFLSVCSKLWPKRSKFAVLNESEYQKWIKYQISEARTFDYKCLHFLLVALLILVKIKADN